MNQQSYYRLKRGKRRVALTRINLNRDNNQPQHQRYTWVFIPRSPTERAGNPHLQLVAWDNLEFVK